MKQQCTILQADNPLLAVMNATSVKLRSRLICWGSIEIGKWIKITRWPTIGSLSATALMFPDSPLITASRFDGIHTTRWARDIAWKHGRRGPRAFTLSSPWHCVNTIGRSPVYAQIGRFLSRQPSGSYRGTVAPKTRAIRSRGNGPGCRVYARDLRGSLKSIARAASISSETRNPLQPDNSLAI